MNILQVKTAWYRNLVNNLILAVFAAQLHQVPVLEVLQILFIYAEIINIHKHYTAISYLYIEKWRKNNITLTLEWPWPFTDHNITYTNVPRISIFLNYTLCNCICTWIILHKLKLAVSWPNYWAHIKSTN